MKMTAKTHTWLFVEPTARLRQLHVDLVFGRVFFMPVGSSAYAHYTAVSQQVDDCLTSSRLFDLADVPSPSAEQIGRGKMRW
jgi:hypothetical protein